MPVDLFQPDIVVQLPNLRQLSFRSAFLHACFAANIWNMIDAFWNGHYLIGAVVALLVLMMARWITESAKPPMEKRMKALQGAVVQLDPDKVKNPMFAGCFMVVTEFRHWGAIGYVQALGEGGKPGGRAYYRAGWEEFEPIGKASWVIGEQE